MDWNKTSVIIGGGHGIGFSIAKELLESSDARLFVTFRDWIKAEPLIKLKEFYPDRLSVFQLDPVHEDQIIKLKQLVEEEFGSLNFLFNAVGFLHDESIKPEKSLRDINASHLMQYFFVNSVVTPLLAKHFSSLFKKDEQSIFTTLSAKVGSIEDNQMGGWYGYRASKAALNMFIKNIDLEFKRKRLPTKVLAIHPGTTETELSKPFIKNSPYTIHHPDEAAKNILKVIKESGDHLFLSWDGQELPW